MKSFAWENLIPCLPCAEQAIELVSCGRLESNRQPILRHVETSKAENNGSILTDRQILQEYDPGPFNTKQSSAMEVTSC